MPSPFDVFLGGSGLAGGGLLGNLELNLQIAIDVIGIANLGKLGQAIEGVLSTAQATIARFNAAIQETGRNTVAVLGVFSAAFSYYAKNATVFASEMQVMNTVLENVGKNAGWSSQQLDQQLESIKKLGITTRVANQTLQSFIELNLDVTQASKLARTAQDLAQASQRDSSETLDRIILAISTYNPMLLHAIGITENMNSVFGRYARSVGKSTSALTDLDKKQALVNLVFEAGAKHAGAYEAAMGDIGKRMRSLNRLYEEMRKEIGERFIPVLGLWVDTQTAVLKAFENLDPRAKTLIAYMGALVTALTTAIPVMTAFRYWGLWFLGKFIAQGTLFAIYRFGRDFLVLGKAIGWVGQYVLPSLAVGSREILGPLNGITLLLKEATFAAVNWGNRSVGEINLMKIRATDMALAFFKYARAQTAAVLAGRPLNVVLGHMLGITGGLTVMLTKLNVEVVLTMSLWTRMLAIGQVLVTRVFVALHGVVLNVTRALWGFIAGLMAMNAQLAITSLASSWLVVLGLIAAAVWKVSEAYKQYREDVHFQQAEEKKLNQITRERIALMDRIRTLMTGSDPKEVGIFAKFYGYGKEESAKAREGIKDQLAQLFDERDKALKDLSRKRLWSFWASIGMDDPEVDKARAHLDEILMEITDLQEKVAALDSGLRDHASNVAAVTASWQDQLLIIDRAIKANQRYIELVPSGVSHELKYRNMAIKLLEKEVEAAKEAVAVAKANARITGDRYDLEKKLEVVREGIAESEGKLAEYGTAASLVLKKQKESLMDMLAAQKITQQQYEALLQTMDQLDQMEDRLHAERMQRENLRQQRLKETSDLAEYGRKQRMMEAQHELAMNQTTIKSRWDYINVIQTEMAYIPKYTDAWYNALSALKSAVTEYVNYAVGEWERHRRRMNEISDKWFNEQSLKLRELNQKSSLFFAGTSAEIDAHVQSQRDAFDRTIQFIDEEIAGLDRVIARNKELMAAQKERYESVGGLLQSKAPAAEIKTKYKQIMEEASKNLGPEYQAFVERVRKSMNDAVRSGDDNVIVAVWREFQKKLRDEILPSMEKEIDGYENRKRDKAMERIDVVARREQFEHQRRMRDITDEIRMVEQYYGHYAQVAIAAIDSILKKEELTESERLNLLEQRRQKEMQLFNERVQALTQIRDEMLSWAGDIEEIDRDRLERQRDELAQYVKGAEEKAALDEWYYRKKKELDDKYKKKGEEPLAGGLTLGMGAFETMGITAMGTGSRILEAFLEQKKKTDEEEKRHGVRARLEPLIKVLEGRIQEAKHMAVKTRYVEIKPEGRDWLITPEGGVYRSGDPTTRRTERDQWLKKWRESWSAPQTREQKAENDAPKEMRMHFSHTIRDEHGNILARSSHTITPAGGTAMRRPTGDPHAP